MTEQARSGRLAELTIALSLATDLGTGQPMEHGLRTCWLALRVSDALGHDTETRSCTYYVSLLRFLGCTSDASETAAIIGGDDVAFNASMAPMLMAKPAESMRHFVRHAAADLPMHRRVSRVLRALADADWERRSLSGHCEVAARLAARLGLGPAVCDALAHAYERWDGKGWPAGLAGDEVPLAVRVASVARDAELWARQAGWQVASDVLSHRRGHAYDPAVVDAIVRDGETWLAEIDDDPRARVLSAEPTPVRTIAIDDLGEALVAVAAFSDLMSPFLRGHSTGVAGLVIAAATARGMGEDDATALGHAALVHDVGRVGVPAAIWDRPGPLTTEHWERVRLHPYLTERVLHHCTFLAPFAEIGSRHHERADGSGYHRGVRGDQLSAGARLLAAADAYHAMTERRPHRLALTAAEASKVLSADVTAGRFGRQEVQAVLDASGQRGVHLRTVDPAGLTEREVEVLRLIARGLVNKEVAGALGISPKTVGRHVEHIYAKAGVTTRAGATLFAIEQGLLSS